MLKMKNAKIMLKVTDVPPVWIEVAELYKLSGGCVPVCCLRCYSKRPPTA